MDTAHLLLNLHQLICGHNLREVIQWMVKLMRVQDIHLVHGLGIPKFDVHHEAVKLRLRQGKGSFILDGVLRGHYHKRLR